MRRLLLIVFLLQTINLHAQRTASVLGKVIDSKTQEPLPGATATLQSNGREVLTNTDGFFVLDQVPNGEHLLTVNTTGYIAKNFNLKVIDGRTLDLGIVALEEDIK